jgi:hypothetical protein
MTIHVEITEPLAGRLATAAQSQGKTPEDIVLEAVAKRLDPFAEVRTLMVPVYDRMQQLGITEDEAVEDFEAEKHAMRQERRTKSR